MNRRVDIMKTYNAIDKIGQAIIADGLCDAVVLKGSIGNTY